MTMKKNINIFLTLLCLCTIRVCSQTIPYGISSDSITIHYEFDSINYCVYYYKPANYDSVNSPILFGIHGQGGSCSSEIGDLQSIADRRKALVVSPTMPDIHETGYRMISHNDINPPCANFYWLTVFLKQEYNNVLLKENRSSIPVYLIGFSAGGQFVTRYMLIRQGHPDSMPIKMAVSVNPFCYTFCTDLLNGVQMGYSCGIFGGTIINYNGNCFPQSDGIADTIFLGFDCNEHILQYYNENYAVLIGNADTIGPGTSMPCILAQGNNRYARAVNFYNFSDTNAVARGTTLKWQYGEVPGVGHNQNLMYNTILVGDSMPLAERLLFETPYHTVPQLAPLANFTADTTIVTLPSATVQFFNNSIMAASYLWDFGDSITSTLFNPSHTYSSADTFTVRLTAVSGTGCENKLIKKDYIIVKLPVRIQLPAFSPYKAKQNKVLIYQ
jgi:PKD repeat protein